MRKLKKALSLTLVLALALSLTVPAFAEGTTETMDFGSTVVTVSNVVYKTTETFNAYWTDQGIDVDVYVVSDDGFTMDVAAKPGYFYDTEDLSEENWSKVAGFHYSMYTWTPEAKGLILGGDGGLLSEPLSQTVGPYTAGSETIDATIYHSTYNIESASSRLAIFYESEWKQMGFSIDTAEPDEPAIPVESVTKTAEPTNDKLYIDGELAVPTAYKIGGSNYFKIRDVAALLNGTDAQFSVDYDDDTKIVYLVTGQSYEKRSSDLAGVPTGNKEAISTNDVTYVNGEKVELTVYKIGGSNYFKLRDLGKALGFNVGYTDGYGAFIETDKPYGA